ncbi:MAG TPA: type IV toxin-antitoxin system AbiEi family antitoxin domain-containing protein [Bryobacteraceae bacterium]|nr:type IV toxin-antitoxin system AbiEi family antitoxin domain-containing protein [Bryobacteraceae bacterium]
MPIAEPLAKVAALAKTAGVLRPRDLDAHGIARQYLRLAEQQGLVVRSGRGLYTAADAPVTELHTIAETSKRVPRGVICLLSALRFHDIGTQNPFEVWIAIGEKDRRPAAEFPPLRVVRFSKQSLAFGQEIHDIEGVPARIFSVAKTVADCFKYRNKIGLDVALEALRECLKQRKATTADLWAAANVCRVANVMKPYMEALV